MRKTRLLFASLLLVISVSCFSQFSKGDRLIGGGVNFYGNNSSYSVPSPNTTYNTNGLSTAVSPRYSWVFKNNKMFGLSLSGNFSRSKNDVNGSEETFTTYGAGLGVFQRNFKDFSSQFGWFIEYGAAFNHSVTKSENILPNYRSESKQNFVSLGLNASPGLYYKLSPKTVVEASFGGIGARYYSTIGGDYDSKGFSFGLNFPSNFTFGVQFLLGSKSKT
ncbi:MAG: hypothetical protein JWQ96_2652 [Segetibacter sp.]|nr:hypothetical protein [Segetibacter sp.]